jgi:hypothetical protein
VMVVSVDPLSAAAGVVQVNDVLLKVWMAYTTNTMYCVYTSRCPFLTYVLSSSRPPATSTSQLLGLLCNAKVFLFSQTLCKLYAVL